ncbi:MAG: PepSY domain-containing protein [Gemmobacter sp.]|uniref:PepSY domain-containing protein n=1 Tax=Gemmobacter sp. TaxID=1898957 RepID=UPI001A621E5B|nr:PepSY domain-containing protein [Gemmobacter sp.]MBL8561693.1 PepSY domain-containing protein [Gemmobacter sp.]
MRKLVVLSTLALGAATLPAWAEERCTVPQAEWRTEADLTADLTAKGWTIAQIKTEDGCYEVYGTDKDGAKQEVFIDPKTFEIVGHDD